MKFKVPDHFVTSVDLDRPYDDVTVYFEYQPAEYDTNTPEGAEIYSIVWDDGEELIDRVSDQALKALADEALEFLADWGQGHAEE
jgi:hypothetical protein